MKTVVSLHDNNVTLFMGSYIQLPFESMYILDDLTAVDRQEKLKWKSEVKTLYEQGTKLRFRAGKWRRGNGVPLDFSGS